MIPELCFEPVDAVRPQLATFCRCVEGGVVVYATDAIDGTVTVSSLICSVPTYFTVLVRAEHATVHVADASGKQYTSGDFVALGTTLMIEVTTAEGYTISQYAVNGTTHTAGSTTTVTVAGTVLVEAVGGEVTP